MEKLLAQVKESKTDSSQNVRRNKRTTNAVSPRKQNILYFVDQIQKKEYASITKDDRIIDALHSILGSNIDALIALEQEVRTGNDLETLHQIRVVIRKMRVSLSFFQSFIPTNQYKQMHTQLRSIFKSLSVERDIDVTIHLLEIEMKKQPKKTDVLQDAMKWLTSQKTEKHQNTITVFDSEQYSQTIGFIKRFISDTPYNQLPANAYFTVEDTVPQMLQQSWKNLRKRGNALTLKSHDEKFHDTRLACKKMRYICESLTSVYGSATADFIKNMKSVQSKLGTLQDTVTAQTVLQPYTEFLRSKGDEKSLHGIEKVMKNLQHKARRQQSKYFVKWDVLKKVKPKLFDLS